MEQNKQTNSEKNSILSNLSLLGKLYVLSIIGLLVANIFLEKSIIVFIWQASTLFWFMATNVLIVRNREMNTSIKDKLKELEEEQDKVLKGINEELMNVINRKKPTNITFK